MMRKGDKLASYKLLAEALQHLDRPWQLLIAGDGEARAEVERAFKPVAGGVFLLGAQPREKLPEIAGACDLCVWPAVNEAFGMALLEAQACGLPVVAGAWGGVAGIVADGKTGWLSAPGDTIGLSADIDAALDADLAAFGRAARAKALKQHDIATAADILTATMSCARKRWLCTPASNRPATISSRLDCTTISILISGYFAENFASSGASRKWPTGGGTVSRSSPAGRSRNELTESMTSSSPLRSGCS